MGLVQGLGLTDISRGRPGCLFTSLFANYSLAPCLGKWLGFTSLYEHRETPELDCGLPTSLDKKSSPQQHNQNSGVVAQAVAHII